MLVMSCWYHGLGSGATGMRKSRICIDQHPPNVQGYFGPAATTQADATLQGYTVTIG